MPRLWVKTKSLQFLRKAKMLSEEQRIEKLKKRINATLQQIGDSMITGGVDSMEKYNVLSDEKLKKLHGWRTRNWSKNVSVIQGDILDRLVCLRAFSTKPDVVIHLATWPRAQIVNDDPIVGIPKVIG